MRINVCVGVYACVRMYVCMKCTTMRLKENTINKRMSQCAFSRMY